MKKFLFGILLLLLTFPLIGAQFRGGTFVELTEEISDDLYITGRNLRIESVVDGDVFGFGRKLVVSGQITEDLNFAGETLTVEGKVMDDVRFIGRELVVRGTVKGDIFLLGGTLMVEKGAKVEGQIYAGTGEVIIRGEVTGPVKASAGEVSIYGKVIKDLNLRVEKLKVHKDAQIEGNLIYKSKKSFQIPEGVVKGKIQFQQIKKKLKKVRKKFFLFTKWGYRIWWLMSALIVGYLFLLLFPRQINSLTKEMEEKPLRSLLFGFAFFIGLAIVAVLFLLLIVTIPAALIIIPLYMIALYLGKLLGSLALGNILFEKVLRKKVSHWITYPVGLLIATLLSFIPLIGWLLILLVRLYGFGGFFVKIKI